MTSYSAIQRAVVGRLTEKGYTVLPHEMQEGFSLPAFFVNVFPVTASIEATDLVRKVLKVEIKYFSQAGTHEANLAMADILQVIFPESPLEVDGRSLSVYGVSFSESESELCLICEFDLEFVDDLKLPEQPKEPMENLILQEEI